MWKKKKLKRKKQQNQEKVLKDFEFNSSKASLKSKRH